MTEKLSVEKFGRYRVVRVVFCRHSPLFDMSNDRLRDFQIPSYLGSGLQIPNS